ncbi:MAG: endopeptidase La [Proteobacteria bacterium]|nr:endopeptidase La [Pseudomonadota bacterium]
MSEQLPSSNEKNTETPAEPLPILPIYDVALFPKMVLPLVVTKDDSMELIDDAMANNRVLGFLVAKNSDIESGYTPDDLYSYGTIAMILKMAKMEDNKAQLMVQGLSRFKVDEFIDGKPYLRAQVTLIKEDEQIDKEIRALMSNAHDLYSKVVELSPGIPQEIVSMAKTIREPGTLADMITSTIDSAQDEKQQILETLDVKKRLKKVTKMLNYQLEILEIGSKIQSQVKEDMGNKQREYYLRQQLKAIQDELGDKDESTADIEEYRVKIKELALPETAEKEAERELKRLSNMHPASSEYTVSLSYLDWICSLPWNTASDDNLDIKKAKKVLDEDHFGLDKAKKRILEFLAVRKLKADSKGPILCFSGPPGTGKTSLGRSIARAMGREFIRIALGGMRDEAEIRGHRRTYVGALPGQIIQGMRRAKTNNPVFVLDEIDKVGASFQGDPSSALLEVLDPEQNFSFADNYLNVPFDLSKVMFITTANVLYTIPPALRDRMEVLDLVGYTDDEKIKIANRYLIPRQRKAHGLRSNNVTFTKSAIKKLISGYTREAGLRNLEREIANICRGVASKVAEGETDSVTIKVINLAKYLGPERVTPEVSSKINKPGVVMGLAWTPAGGELLFIEAIAMKGKGGLILTGQLGDVMKESVSTALSFIRANAKKLKVDEAFFAHHDIHIHVPAGAIPKDGPSAGVTMLTALTSLASEKLVINKMAMTGEITLRGIVLPVGGVKEKVLAAHRAGIKTIILPESNKNDLDEIPNKVKKAIQFHFVEKMINVIEVALEK